jgi:hypothetical protein
MTKENMLLDMMKKAGIYSYAIDKTNYKLLFMDEAMKSFKKEAKVGDVCYKAFYNRDKPCENCQIAKNDFEQLIFDPCAGGIWFKGTGYGIELEGNPNAAVMLNARTVAPKEITVVHSKAIDIENFSFLN